ncbi:hypothetical protein B0H14DRAFT_2586498 [Mycena olivaceomarginata]|nr:hypothetical protein B0H14DRAFT_2586498 [Mycena olivaceomarginata]
MPLRSDTNADKSGEKRRDVRSKARTEMAGRRQGPIHHLVQRTDLDGQQVSSPAHNVLKSSYEVSQVRSLMLMAQSWMGYFGMHGEKLGLSNCSIRSHINVPFPADFLQMFCQD